MYVLTVKFGSVKAPKTYDYLYVNPKKEAVDFGRPLRMVVGTSGGKILHVIKKTKMDYLPEWVTAQIVIDDRNDCHSEKITAGHVRLLRPPKSRGKPPVKQEEEAEKTRDEKLSLDELRKDAQKKASSWCAKILRSLEA